VGFVVFASHDPTTEKDVQLAFGLRCDLGCFHTENN
jgi:alpha-D-ribose 1-methylphosphonate 5-triphosphate diphosphatase PhnM